MKSVTEREAIEVFDGLRKAYRSLEQSGNQVVAQNVLSNSHVIPSSMIWGPGSLPSALGTLRAVFDAIDAWEGRQS